MTQKDRLMCLFRDRPNQWIPLPEILKTGIAQYNARIKELREEGIDIQNRIEHISGERHSWYMYVSKERQLSFV